MEQQPKRIILIRHGESLGNRDRTAYARTPDNKIGLTDRGFAQGVVAGLQLRTLIGNESVRFFVSPYVRAKQTLLAMLKAFDGQTVQVSLEPRLREQDFGNFQDPDEMDDIFSDRQKFGRFYYRFANGEAGTDVFDRMASFITYLLRPPDHKLSEISREDEENIVLVTHGLLMRIFCMCYLRWSVSEFEQVWNPNNCEIWVLERPPEVGIYCLRGSWRSNATKGRFVPIKFGKNKREPLFEHMTKPLSSRTVTPGAPDALDSDELRFLRDLPPPIASRPKSARARTGRNQKLEAGAAILDYWAKDSKRSAETRGDSK